VIDAAVHTESAPPQTRADALARAVAIAEGLPARWVQTEQLRRVPDETMDELKASGLLRLNQPARFGGPELGVETILDVGATIAGGDVSVGWAYVILASHEWIIGLFPDQAQHDIWDDDPTVLMSSSFAPSKATVTRVDGGWRLTDGTWPFSSGSDHAQWAMVGFRTPPGDDGSAGPVRWGLVPRSEYSVGTDWRTIGAQGTGSNSLSIADTVVPDHRTLDPILALMGMTPGAEVNTSRLFRSSFNSLAVYLAAPILGGARAAVRDFTTYMESKRLIYTGERVGTEGAMLVHLGEVAAKASVAETVLRAAARRIDDPDAEPVDVATAMGLARDCTFAVQLCADAVDETMRRSGGSALYEGHQANKWWRDVRGLAAHQGFNTDTAYGNWGRFSMGLPPLPGPFG
jgi:3-hydroxy-9,10-secoandrosta-1,3,5(10)-triene-9,17-dione monooxygenase